MYKYQVRIASSGDGEVVQIVDDQGQPLRLSGGSASWTLDPLYAAGLLRQIQLCCEIANAAYLAAEQERKQP